MRPGITQLAVTQTADGIVIIKPLLCLGRRFHMPLDDRHLQGRSHLPGKLGFTCSGLPLHQQRPLQRDGCIDRHDQIIRCHISSRRGEFHHAAKPLWGDVTVTLTGTRFRCNR